MSILKLFISTQEKTTTYLDSQINKLHDLADFKINLKLWYKGKHEWILQYADQMELAFKKSGLEVASLLTNIRDNSGNVIEPSFDMPTSFTVEIRANMIGNRRPIKKSYNNSAQLEVSADKLTNRLQHELGFMDIKSVHVNQYSLEANEDGSAGTVMITLSF